MTIIRAGQDGEDFGYFGYPTSPPTNPLSLGAAPIRDHAPAKREAVVKAPRPLPERSKREIAPLPPIVIPHIEHKPIAPIVPKRPLKDARLGITFANSVSVSEALAYLPAGITYNPSDVSVDVESSAVALRTYLKSQIEHEFRLGEERIAAASIYGMDNNVYSAYRKLCQDRQDDFVRGIVTAEKDRLNGQIQREKIKASIVNDLIPARASIISSVVPMQSRVEIANAEMATEDSIVGARLATALEIAANDVNLRIAIADANAGTRLSIAEASANTSASIAAADAATRVSIATQNAATRESIAEADRITRERIADAGCETQKSIGDAMASATIQASYNSYQGYVFSAAASWAYGLSHILAAGASQMGKPGIGWVE